ncbi:PPE family protein [Mycobacterium angelicum]|uniref:PPE family protein n=1 Tax=Mycobacterium angelicum TaxID=470074 RepID=A0A1X0A8J1_MYCAN|nr:PPE family protein [Mycobacterium angelicum]MCV7197414.1 PPE family protein [Mycobacterium angelicum]ORA26324.1 hypothetical protein BST12_00035 [Mycobacterium angelicum]
MFDFAALPPELNSGRIYSGPGSGPMLAAASAWDAVAAELRSAATSYNAVITELTSAPWVGPASRAMVSAVVPYVSWLSAASGQAEEAATQARAAVAAYETAFTLTVPPPVIAANRVLSLSLIATNFFGQNTPAIAAAEANYLEMWAQDATAMYGYAASSALATELSRFSSPPITTNPNAAGGEAAGVAHAAGAVAAENAQDTAATIPQLLASAPTAQPNFIWNTIVDFFKYGLPTPDNNWAGLYPGMYTAIRQTLQAYFGIGVANFGWSIGQQLFNGLGTTAGSGGAWYPTPQFAALGAGGWHFHGGAGLTASISSSSKIGGLSVPASWAGAPGAAAKVMGAEFVHSASATNPATGINAALPGLPAGSRGATRAGNGGIRYGLRYAVLTRPPSGG